MALRAIFRTDASFEIGTGHVMRCLTLADSLSQYGYCVQFVCRAHSGNLIDFIRQRGYAVHALELGDSWHVRPLNPADQPEHLAWLGEDWEKDAEQTVECMRDEPVDLLVVDHYAIEARWEAAMWKFSTRLMCIDDLANRGHSCDLLLDQNLYAAQERRYAGLLPDTAKILIGPRFALLRPEFLRARQRLRKRDGVVRRVFLFMGGADRTNVTTTVLEALTFSRQADLAIDVVVGGTSPHTADVEAVCANLANARLHRQVENMADLMMEADLAIGATGTTTWERAALGLPTLAVSVADNQRDIAHYANAAGILTWIGDAETIALNEWTHFIDDACASADRLRRQSEVGLDLVDACGTQRVVEAML